MTEANQDTFLNSYQDRWESRSSIRTRPRKFIDFSLPGYFFPPEKQVLLLLPEVTALGESIKREILLRSFYKYLNDIIHLEIKWVYSTCSKIIQNDLCIFYSELAKLNAYTVIIDEYYHVYIAQDMISQLRHHYPALAAIDLPNPDSNNAINTIKNKLDQKYHDIFEVIATCIFETTLVRELVEYFSSDSIHPAIKYYINDHMNDESRHYIFFFEILCNTWQGLPEEYKKNIGEILSEFIGIYLNISSDKFYNLSLLEEIGFSFEEATQMVEKLCSDFVISSEIPMVKHVLSVLEKSKVLDCVYVKSGFVNDGLLE